jgi:hypothetical protein
MTTTMLIRSGMVAIALSSATTGCFVEGGTEASGPMSQPPPVVTPTGTLALQWTIDGQVSPGSCDIGGATTLHIQLTTTSGAFAGEFEADCAQFATTIPSLAADGYTSTAELQDASGALRTTSIQITPFTIVSDSTLVINIDFPPDSFLR